MKHAGDGHWNDLDALDIGDGALDGINDQVRLVLCCAVLLLCCCLLSISLVVRCSLSFALLFVAPIYDDGVQERQTYATLWVISAAPLYTGDDMTKLDAWGMFALHCCWF